MLLNSYRKRKADETDGVSKKQKKEEEDEKKKLEEQLKVQHFISFFKVSLCLATPNGGKR